MNKFHQQKQALTVRQEEVRQHLAALEEECGQVDGKLEALHQDEAKHQLLDEISDRLNKLEEAGAGDLFWAEHYKQDASKALIHRLQKTVGIYHANINLLHERKSKLQEQVEDCRDELFDLDAEFREIRQAEEEVHYQYEVTRELEDSAFRDGVMPWSTNGDDERRFRRSVLACLLLAFFLGFGVHMWQLPEPDEDEVVEVPERLAKLVLEKKKPKPKPQPVVKKPEEKVRDLEKPKQQVAKEEPKPSNVERKQVRKKVERAGVLAFKDNFQDLIQDDLDNRLGNQTQLSTAGKKENRSQRSLITAAATSGSDGINTSALSRNSGGVGSALDGVSFSRVSSGIGTEGDFAGEDRPLSDGVGPSRTDEEIQIVFDRYKSALYRIYNRELRNNPALQGKMVLRITILPDGSVSLAAVETSDMDSPALDSKIVARVKRFNFGEKAGVPTITILYPIDFLPAA
ncbi:AgmX/PglI C-terminal domain-containing protein [Microbulbifer agarilyticus]|uniref:AgmX/PglI C-terminal domain-containing protein n=1 Tax=Microbulbifer agarilyticus TaxID=260552 RepID=UPI001C980879|nr:AgmX/PglI C-terminal domain-containing protein [Microbulbifer agarilyticus]MBY6190449.1 AgmX/PglI C-terminal domain-containing protein [Microbulbifer agarilyticus]